ncbi:hypothetical protein [Candidatus Thiosymbion oneisti]|uniref:hypothetical protein n=1 Tax=Candidatus Thiosymbion oneisti TaxID=589554 RepID=UPI001062163B|nr:hypothetical protein [Candidatus Thiosymbion oneisti]
MAHEDETRQIIGCAMAVRNDLKLSLVLNFRRARLEWKRVVLPSPSVSIGVNPWFYSQKRQPLPVRPDLMALWSNLSERCRMGI